MPGVGGALSVVCRAEPRVSTGAGPADLGALGLERDRRRARHDTPMDTAGLRADFERILRDSISCEVTLNGQVTEGLECEGTVEVDGVKVPCDPNDGWRLKDPRTLELVGKACSDLRGKPTAQIRADFPCGVILF